MNCIVYDHIMFRGTWEPFLYSKSGKDCFIIYTTSFEISILAFKTHCNDKTATNIQGFKIKFWWNEKWVNVKSLHHNVVFMLYNISIINLSRWRCMKVNIMNFKKYKVSYRNRSVIEPKHIFLLFLKNDMVCGIITWEWW